jgi:hypothetical protein
MSVSVPDSLSDDTPEWLGLDFFVKLTEIDEEIARRVGAAGCPICRGPLHRSDYVRKPRGGWLAASDEGVAVRFSLCCGRQGCRRRALPPSVRFLGRRVYWEGVVLLASVRVLMLGVVQHAERVTGVPRRTLRRWRAWWQGDFPQTSLWTVMRARFPPPPPDASQLPLSLLDRLAREMGGSTASTAVIVLIVAARWLAPATTRSVPDSARFVWSPSSS